jgi:hypothetical protein
MVLLKSQASELTELKEYTAYLLDTIQNMRLELKELADKYHDARVIESEDNCTSNILNRISLIADDAQIKMLAIGDRKTSPSPFPVMIKKDNPFMHAILSAIHNSSNH